jgi:hypothetical protein
MDCTEAYRAALTLDFFSSTASPAAQPGPHAPDGQDAAAADEADSRGE